jgi:hypothetical protein
MSLIHGLAGFGRIEVRHTLHNRPAKVDTPLPHACYAVNNTFPPQLNSFGQVSLNKPRDSSRDLFRPQ